MTSQFLYMLVSAEFRSRVTCEGEEMHLRCSKSERIAIYSAMFGRSTRGGQDCPVQTAYDAGEYGPWLQTHS